MKRTMQRGHIVALMLIVLAVLSTSVVVFSGRLSVDILARRNDAVRSQTLWLARSALQTGQRGTQTVQTAHGSASVRVSGGRATVILQGNEASITADPWTERYTRQTSPIPPSPRSSASR